jgi:hypothetical protein
MCELIYTGISDLIWTLRMFFNPTTTTIWLTGRLPYLYSRAREWIKQSEAIWTRQAFIHAFGQQSWRGQKLGPWLKKQKKRWPPIMIALHCWTKHPIYHIHGYCRPDLDWLSQIEFDTCICLFISIFDILLANSNSSNSSMGRCLGPGRRRPDRHGWSY